MVRYFAKNIEPFLYKYFFILGGLVDKNFIDVYNIIKQYKFIIKLMFKVI